MRKLLIPSLFLSGVAVAALLPAAGASLRMPGEVTDPVRYVNPHIGTGDAGGDVGTGNTSPAAALPFGMIQLGPDTDGRTAAGYLDTADAITGFSLNHLSGMGCDYVGNDGGFLPVVGELSKPEQAREEFSQDDSVAAPGYYATTLRTSGVAAAMAVTRRGAVSEFSYPGTDAARMLVRASSLNTGSGGSISIDPTRRQVTAAIVNNTREGAGGFCDKPNTYTVYLAARFDEAFTGYGTWRGDAVSAGSTSAEGSRPAGTAAGGYLTFDTREARTVHMRVGMSYVSAAAAVANLDAEVGTRTLAEVRAAASTTWTDLLHRVRVTGGNEIQRTNFYTALYHATLAPNLFSDADGRYPGMDQQVHQLGEGQAAQYTNYSGWDTYRSQAALVALLDPVVAADQAQSLVNMAEQGGFLPKWPVANGYTQVMAGDPADNIIAATYAFGGRTFDTGAALAAMLKGAEHGGGGADGVGQWGYVEREANAEYLSYGYVPGNPSLTLEYAANDAAIAQFAKALGRTDLYQTYLSRAQNWQNVVNPYTATGPYVQQRDGGGGFPPGPGFQPPGDGAFGQPGFNEGNATQYTFMVTHNPAGLVAALGGDAAATARLDAFFDAPAGERWGMAGPNAPYYWFGNEPTFGHPWLYNYTGAPWKTQRTVRAVLDRLFTPASNGLPGNDDLGAVSAWYVWGALGLYPLNPGTADLQLAVPLFPHVEVVRPDGAVLAVDAPGADAGPRYITGATVDGERWSRPWLPAAKVTAEAGTTVRLALSATPDTSWGTAPGDRPPSDRTGEAAGIGYTSPAGELVVPAGGTGTVRIGVRGTAADPATVSWSATAPTGLTLSTTSGSLAVEPARDAAVDVTVSAGPDTPAGSFDLPVRFSASHSPQPVLLRVTVVPAGSG
ncbi:GH92 family glycosyl hydrolase [Plantactinospora mayteni]|uniref:Alpha-1,2-mannosidase n=1 Tax=Plantactinospora mayteni TaxID=566021 RepID=A0ABQ4F1Q2_9ACTN|nr:GH92 family glycosyl hydrolase [Plantactinospora mayteni]GIH00798.1 alpha-1,2-mannosidase [Plantactinospora mayteni]